MITKKVFHWLEAVALGVAIVLASAVVSHRMDKAAPAQAQTFAIQNGLVTGTTSGVTQNFTPSQFGSVRIYSVAAVCSTGSASLTIQQINSNGSTTAIWGNKQGDIGTTLSSYYWTTPLQGPVGLTVQVVVNSCGGGGVPSLDYQASVN